MKLDVTCLRYLSKEDFRVMEAIELGMRNHEVVPVELISSLAKLRHGGIHKFLSNILRYKLVAHTNTEYNGYRLSYLGYDILALHTLLMRGVITSVGSQIGVGKESDIFEAIDENGNEIVLKIHRLGRTSFRSVRRNRDYMSGKSKASWLYMSRLAAIKEFAFMKALFAHSFPTPAPIDQNRHVVAMSRVSGFPLAQIKAGMMEYPERVFATCVSILQRLAEHGLIHCDFNEFNLMVDSDYKITMIDFPQMVSVSHINAIELFNRDLEGLVKFFAMKMRFIPCDDDLPDLAEILSRTTKGERIDEEVKASGFSNVDDDELTRFYDEKCDDESVDESSHPMELEVDARLQEEDEKDENKDEESSDIEDTESPHVNHAILTTEEKETIRQRVRRTIEAKEKGAKASRNSTKKRNKYGKIDRVDRSYDRIG